MKIEITSPCRVKGEGYKIGQVAEVSEEDYYRLCGFGKGKAPTKKEPKGVTK